MASAVQDIGDLAKKCKILLLDIEGTTTSISFVKDKLFPYAEENVQKFLESEWETDDVKEAVAGLRKLSLEDKGNSVDGVVLVPGEDASKEEQIEGLVKNVKWLMGADRKVGPLKLLQGLIWKQGYDNGSIKGHVYDDVLPALELWRSSDDQKVYIYSSGSVQAQKLLFGQSLAGDLLKHINGHFDTAVGAKQEADSYTKIVKEIGCKTEDVVFLTDIVKEAEAARAAGVAAVLVSREGNAPLPEDARASFPVLHSFAQLAVSNKRKPEETQEEQPAKIPKTDVTDDVKTSSEANKETTEQKPTNETETMEVEDVPVLEKATTDNTTGTNEKGVSPPTATVDEVKDVPKLKNVATCANNPDIVEQSKTADVATCANNPDILEQSKSVEKTEEVQTEEMETEVSEPIVKKPDDETSSEKPAVADETSSITITEIEDITDKGSPEEAVEIVEDLVPVVEEPTNNVEMEELQNVGEVLEKECDEILSKVQDVTNLENIPLKPLLKPIAEETMDTENTDTNDIVERILDTEQELEMKQNNDIALKNVSKMSDENEKEKAKENGAKENSEQVKNIETTEEKPVEKESVQDKTEESKPETKVEVISKDEEVKQTVDTPKETTDNKEKISEKKEVEAPVAESKEAAEQNGQTNGTKAMNGDANKELSSRLSVENGKPVENGKEVNGTNGEAAEENGNGDSKVQPEVPEIKVKTVATDEMRNDPPIAQTVEA